MGRPGAVTKRGFDARPALGGVAIAATYVSTVVGAGFASGQEVLRFFTHFGPWGLAGLGVATVLLGLGGTAIMLESRWAKARTHGDLLAWLGGGWFAKVYDVLITAFLFGTTAVMVAGSGAFFQEQLGLPRLTGDMVMAAAAVATVLVGLRGVVVASEVVVPFLLLGVAAVTVATLAAHGGPLVPGAGLGGWRPAAAAAPNWGLAAVLYASYNLLLAPAVLTPLAVRAGSPRAVVLGGVLGGVLLGLAAMGVNLSLLGTLPGAGRFEVPMLYVAGLAAGRYAAAARFAYGLVLWGEIYTTAVGLLYGFACRLAGGGGSPRRGDEGLVFRRWVLAGGLGALLAARVGFSNMVATLYPLVGYAGLVLLLVTIVRLRRGGRPG